MKITTRFSVMLNQFAFTLVLGLAFNTMAFSQITITSNDMPSPNDTVRKSQALTTGGIDYTVTGTNHVWDFSTLEPLTQTVDTFVTVNSVPFLYQLVFIPNIVANVAQKFSEIDTIPDLPITDPFRFFRKTTNTYNDVGYAISVSGIPIPVRLNPADVIYKLPLAYGNLDSSNASGQLGVPGFGYIGIQRKRVNQVDGWGSLTTPFGTYDVLRLKSTVYETDSIYLDTLNFGTTIERTYIEYKWLANGHKAPLLQVTEEGPLVQVAYKDYILDPTVSVGHAMLPEASISISPNPFTDYAVVSVIIERSSKITISLVNLTGVEVYTVYDGQLPEGKHFFTLNVAGKGLPKATYLLNVENDGISTYRKVIIH
ncbi:MAG: T9SS type A sorting domain-containing protein [Bacteroidales bacterium]|nr:T9SS type A sorting domain-containing protein [Bacteroidales bacterium]